MSITTCLCLQLWRRARFRNSTITNEYCKYSAFEGQASPWPVTFDEWVFPKRIRAQVEFLGFHSFVFDSTCRVPSMNSDDQRWNVTFRWIRNHCVSPHACQSKNVAPTPLGLPARRYAVIGNGVGVTSTSVMGPAAGCGLIATMPFMPRDVITAYHGELLWMPAVTAKASISSTDPCHSHYKRISGSDFVICGVKGVDISFGCGGASVANCAASKLESNAKLQTLFHKKHEDFLWCPSTKRYERVNGTYLVATKPISVNEEILTWYGEATCARLSLNRDTDSVTESSFTDNNGDADAHIVSVEGGSYSHVRVHPLNHQTPPPQLQGDSEYETRFEINI
jgi:hypothetical protein